MKSEQHLLTKLNFKNHLQVALLNSPEDVLPLFNDFPNSSKISTSISAINGIDFFIAFVHNKEEIEHFLSVAMPKMAEDAPIWFCYPKGSSKKYKAAINRDTGWDALITYNLEPVRLVSINDDWSALRVRNVKYIKVMKRSFAKTEAGKSKIIATKTK